MEERRFLGVGREGVDLVGNEGNEMDEKEMILLGDEVLTGPQQYHLLLMVMVGR